MTSVVRNRPRQPAPVTVQASRAFLHIRWDLLFSDRRELNLEAENKSRLEVIAEAGLDNKFGNLAAWLKELENAIRQFMRGPDDSDICTPEASIILAFCSKSS